MKNTKFVFLSLIALVLSACGGKGGQSQSDSQQSDSGSALVSSSQQTSNQTSNRSSNQQSSQTSNKTSSSQKSKSEGPANANFTLLEPDNLSSMSPNCKKYVDDMRAQQKRLVAEKGANADYYLNDLYGTNGVDLTKGVLPSTNNYQDRTGGYRPANHQSEYLDDVAARWEDGEKSDENKGVEIEFRPANNLKNQEYTIKYGKLADLSDAKEIKTTDTCVSLKNLLVNQKYYYQVQAGSAKSEIDNFTTGDYPRWINARPMFNVRDHGGYMTSSGQRIKQGMVYRGGEITPAVGWKDSSFNSYTGDVGGRYTGSDGKMVDQHITSQTDASKKAFREDMNMVGGLEIDLRSSSERNNYSACGFANNGDISYSLISISSYANGMKNNTSQIKQVFEAFAQADQHPVYYHCYGGADRTGVVGFMLGALLGMSYTDLVIDFELTSYSSNPSRNYRSHLRNGPWNEWPGMVTYLKNDLGWGTTKTIKQGMEEYLKSKCSVSQTTIDKIRSIMLEPIE